MGKAVWHFGLSAALAVICGCGLLTVPVDVPAGGGEREVDAQDDASSTTEAPDPATIATPIVDPAPIDTAGPRTPALDPGLLSSLLNLLILDLVNPVGPAESFTFLELLCLEGDDPDFVCRQLFGR